MIDLFRKKLTKPQGEIVSDKEAIEAVRAGVTRTIKIDDDLNQLNAGLASAAPFHISYELPSYHYETIQVRIRHRRLVRDQWIFYPEWVKCDTFSIVFDYEEPQEGKLPTIIQMRVRCEEDADDFLMKLMLDLP